MTLPSVHDKMIPLAEVLVDKSHKFKGSDQVRSLEFLTLEWYNHEGVTRTRAKMMKMA